jgi:hypothetical protein
MTSPATRPVRSAPLLLASAFALASVVTPMLGCRSDSGTHRLAIAGSDAVMQGLTTADAWTVSFEQVAVVVHHPGLIERVNNRPVYVREPGITLWDAREQPDADEALAREVRASRYDGAIFSIAPPGESGYELVAGNVEANLVAAAVEDDWSVRVVGSATNAAAETIRFDWAFATSTHYRCEFDGDAVVEITDAGDETTTIEILAELLLQGDGGALDFEAIAAADADGDGEVTAAELDSAGLWDGLEDASRGVGGIRGAGACSAVDD